MICGFHLFTIDCLLTTLCSTNFDSIEQIIQQINLSANYRNSILFASFSPNNYLPFLSFHLTRLQWEDPRGSATGSTQNSGRAKTHSGSAENPPSSTICTRSPGNCVSFNGYPRQTQLIIFLVNCKLQHQQNFLRNSTLLVDPFYGPILQRIDKIFLQMGIVEEGCKERLVCSMYKNPARFSPHSNFISAELSRWIFTWHSFYFKLNLFIQSWILFVIT